MKVPQPGLGAILRATASCPEKRAVLGGGGSASEENVKQNVALYESTPIADDSGVTVGWSVQALQGAEGDTPWTLQAFVVCGPLP